MMLVVSCSRGIDLTRGALARPANRLGRDWWGICRSIREAAPSSVAEGHIRARGADAGGSTKRSVAVAMGSWAIRSDTRRVLVLVIAIQPRRFHGDVGGSAASEIHQGPLQDRAFDPECQCRVAGLSLARGACVIAKIPASRRCERRARGCDSDSDSDLGLESWMRRCAVTGHTLPESLSLYCCTCAIPGPRCTPLPTGPLALVRRSAAVIADRICPPCPLSPVALPGWDPARVRVWGNVDGEPWLCYRDPGS